MYGHDHNILSRYLLERESQRKQREIADALEALKQELEVSKRWSAAYKQKCKELMKSGT